MSENTVSFNGQPALFRKALLLTTRLDDFDPDSLDPAKPVLIAGPTASGKSELALRIAEAQGGIVINADALQVFDGWRILTARPDDADLARAPHALYGHVPYDADYSVGAWLRDLTPLLRGPERPIIVGGTGLYFTALTTGLAQIPATPPEVRALADARIRDEGFEALLAELDPESAARLDRNNPVRVQRAWEVLTSTGRGIAAWQDDTPPPIMPLTQAQPLCIMPNKEWLNARIRKRFHLMMEAGALAEAQAMLPLWNPNLQSSKAIGAPELIAKLQGEMSESTAIEAAIIASRQYAKRQRSWLRGKMAAWHQITA
ncbi:tRNA (adenosine(37)-N6)-dimethylallyltransferase MiaA [Donghicola tyrosinivorans]|uniref:tRNA dimethylallyltransferase n=1 Tax=Donghicola tyrosinivorans TaxID=1652492 RepID=A0A2T0X5S4_9RHOB|nr:tRNA dimethylallyltransferase [Donghicola tyrosinivorans]